MSYYWAGSWQNGYGYTVNHAVYGVSFPYNATLFACTQDHVASASDEPGIGANWEDYWDETPFSGYEFGYYLNDPYWIVLVNQCVSYPFVGVGPVYRCTVEHNDTSNYTPGVGVDWEDVWEIIILAGSPPPTTNPWYGLAITGTLIVATQVSDAFTGTYIIANGQEAKIVLRAGSFINEHGGYDDLEDILSDCGVTFV